MNLNGDYLSDALAAQVGGIGIAPGANINYTTGMAIFEATHGTAPKYADQDKVNPRIGDSFRGNDAALFGLDGSRRYDYFCDRHHDRKKDGDLRFRTPDGRRDGSEVQRVRLFADRKHVLRGKRPRRSSQLGRLGAGHATFLFAYLAGCRRAISRR